MKSSTFLATLLATCTLSACASQSEQIVSPNMSSHTMNESNTSAPDQNQISTIGTVRFQEIEGGFWGIVADDGQKFDPMGLEPKFQKDGLRVSFKAIPETDMMSTHMWGKLIKMTHIEKIK